MPNLFAADSAKTTVVVLIRRRTANIDLHAGANDMNFVAAAIIAENAASHLRERKRPAGQVGGGLSIVVPSGSTEPTPSRNVRREFGNAPEITATLAVAEDS